MKRTNWSYIIYMTGVIFLYLIENSAFAAASAATSLTGLQTTLSGSIGALTQMVFGVAYVAGIGFALGAIMKFKQHKDNPTQIPIGTPISMTFIAAALLFLPTVLTVTGMSVFGTTSTPGTAGTIWGGAAG